MKEKKQKKKNISEEIQPENGSEFMRVKDVAAISKVSPRTIWRIIADGDLKAYRFRRCTRLLRSQVMNYLKGNGKVGGV